MSFYKPRIGRTNPSGHPIHPGPGDHVASASSADFPQPLDPSLSDATPAAARQADLVCLADIEPRPIDWLWTDRLAAGAVSVLSGDPGSGKTWVALAIAAGLSRGRSPAPSPPAGTPILVPSSTPQPRTELPSSSVPALRVSNGDPAPSSYCEGPSPPALPNRPSSALREQRSRKTPSGEPALGCSSSTPCTASWGPMVTVPTTSGRVFDNLARLAENHRCCILLIRHLRKRGRGLVPVELWAAVRTEFLAGSSPDAPTQPALVQVKSNLGLPRSVAGICYR